MINKEQIIDLFHKLNEKLRTRGVKGEIGVVGGSVMCIAFDARAATKDVDAIFEPSSIIRAASREIAQEKSLPTDWLNDAAMGYLSSKFRKDEVLSLSHLIIWVPDPKGMLAMKCISARWDTSDKDDVEFLIKHIGLKDAESVLESIEYYYPKKIVPAKTQFFIEELVEKLA